MTLEEKIAHLQTTSMEQARLEGNVIIDTHQAALEKVFEDHKAEATRQSETRIKAEAANAKLSLIRRSPSPSWRSNVVKARFSKN